MSNQRNNGPIALRISVTDRCQLRCLYCMGPEGVHKVTHREILSFEEIVRFVRALKVHFGLSKVRITGGEPLVRPGITKLVEMLTGEGIPDLALTTNGQQLGRMAAQLKQAGLQRINMSLDSLHADTYRRLTRGGELQCSLDGLEAALHYGLAPVKLNTIVLRGINSAELTDMVRFGLEHGCEVRFLELMPIGPAADYSDDWFVSSAEVLAKLAEDFELTPSDVQPGSSSRNYLAKDGQGRTGIVGIISSRTDAFCGQCRRLRLTATGKLVGCLARPEGYNVRSLLQADHDLDSSQLLEAIRRALDLKQKERCFSRTTLMVETGG
ncbi:MAG: GTP 3',8-cyclase MoaA [Actinobacteria bacterium]|nr:GTP 3',8-cyclase MoaA [Actinomycetota bacterium]